MKICWKHQFFKFDSRMENFSCFLGRATQPQDILYFLIPIHYITKQHHNLYFKGNLNIIQKSKLVRPNFWETKQDRQKSFYIIKLFAHISIYFCIFICQLQLAKNGWTEWADIIFRKSIIFLNWIFFKLRGHCLALQLIIIYINDYGIYIYCYFRLE